MSETQAAETADVAETETEAAETGKKPTDTVDFWKAKAREQESRAKSNAKAAARLAELEDAQKSEAEKAADRISRAEAEVQALPGKIAEALKTHLVELHQIDTEDAELFLTATEPELLLKQVSRLLAQDKRKRNNRIAREGENHNAETTSDLREFTRSVFGG